MIGAAEDHAERFELIDELDYVAPVDPCPVRHLLLRQLAAPAQKCQHKHGPRAEAPAQTPASLAD
jgi:hypothetical protein